MGSRVDSFSSTYNHSHLDDHYSEPKSPRSRGFTNPTPLPQPAFGYGRHETLSTPSPTAASVPWLGADELRSSFRSQLTTSTGFHGGNTERSSVLTKDSSVTSLSANADEPSLEDVMGMYEEGFEDKPGHYETDNESRLSAVTSLDYDRHAKPLEPVEEDAPRQATHLPPVEDDMLRPPKISSLDNEIRQSKLFFFSPAFASSVAHLATAGERSTDKRDSDKSQEYDVPAQRPTTATEPHVLDTPDPSDFESRQASGSPDSQYSEPSAAPLAPKPVATTEPPNSGKTTPVYDQPVPEPEEPGSRDRYGFKKANQNVTREQYDNWDKGYTEYLARRKKKWVAFLKENSLMTDRPNRFPDSTKNNAKTKRFIRKGIPPEWRGAAWFYYAGGPAILRAHGGLYDKLLRKTPKQVDQEAIERDLHRTFPDNVKFKPAAGPDGEIVSDSDTDSFDSHQSPSPGQVEGEQPIISSLRRVLRAFSVYNPRIGYCQSLNFLAGLLLLFVETEEQCFWLLNVITHIYLPGTHEISLEGSKVDLSVLMAEIRDTMPAVWDKIGGDLEAQPDARPATSKSLRRPTRMKRKDTTELSTERLPPITLCMTAWFMSCFIGTLPIETTLRVWDIFFYEGSKTLFRVALSIFKVGEAEVRAVKDPMEMFGVVQAMPRRMIDANALMEACFKRRNGFGHLTQNTIDERRQERRDTAQRERDEQAKASQDLLSGNVTDVEPEVRRKNTLFGRKKRDASRTRAAGA